MALNTVQHWYFEMSSSFSDLTLIHFIFSGTLELNR